MAGVLVYQGAVAELNTELSSIHQKIVISCYGLKLFSDVTMLIFEADLALNIHRRIHPSLLLSTQQYVIEDDIAYVSRQIFHALTSMETYHMKYSLIH